ncbi:nitronate monooxygenase [Streptomyces sp. NRRL F-5630]|uniref:nitronate monooxygenase n=1 Tax=Streptomyces sp. NRRL F-5630 TaxID=1463864 RepID=UPI003D72F9BC
MSSVFGELLRHPVVQAPMAGGASCPELAAAVSEAGGLGFLAGGYKSVAAVQDEVRSTRELTGRPFGVNLFLPQPEADADAVEAYADGLAEESERYGAPLGGLPDGALDDFFDAKVAVLLAEPVAVVSFTFGCPSRDVLDAFQRVGTLTVVTVTTPEEARAAQWAGADALCVQGVEAGGHQGTHHDDPATDGCGLGLLSLLEQVRQTVPLPFLAAGGLMRGTQIAAVLAAGAEAAQLGTAFLPCPESGAHPVHKAALTSPHFTRTTLTRAFSGRPARGLVNRFVRVHSTEAPAAYPRVHHLTAGLRRAAAGAGDADGMALWAGQGHRLARTVAAGRLVETLAAETRAALTPLER